MKRKDERGSLIIEASISFVIFLSALVSIISLINVVTVQNRVQYALNQTAREVAKYAYVWTDSGINEVRGQLEELKDNFIVGNIVKFIDGAIEDLIDGSSLGPMMKQKFEYYVGGDEYLRRYNVIDGIDGVEIYGSLNGVDLDLIMLGSDEQDGDGLHAIELVAEYDIDYRFVLLPLSFKEIHMVHRAPVKAWMYGS